MEIKAKLWERKLKYYEEDESDKQFIGLPEVQNIVTSICINSSIDLRSLCKIDPSIEYFKNKFAAVVSRNPIGITPIGPTDLIYSTGKIVKAGSKNIFQSLYLTHILMIYLGNMDDLIYKYDKDHQLLEGYPQKKKFLWRVKTEEGMKIANIVAKDKYESSDIDMVQISRNFPKVCIYEPDKFPAIRIKFKDLDSTMKNGSSNCSVEIFDTGYVVYMGVKCLSTLKLAQERIREMIHYSNSNMDYSRIMFVMWYHRNKNLFEYNFNNNSKVYEESKKLEVYNGNRFQNRVQKYRYSEEMALINMRNKIKKTDLSSIPRSTMKKYNIYLFTRKISLNYRSRLV